MSTVAEDIPLGATLTEEQARRIFSQGEEAVVFALLQLAKQLAKQKAASAAGSHQTPSTPSGMKPPYSKPPPGGRKKKPGRKKGHPGARRKTPDHVDRQMDHQADRCPDCGGPLNRCGGHRTGSHRAHDPPGLVSEVPEKGRTDGDRGLARLDLGQPRVGPLGLAALCLGQYARVPLACRQCFHAVACSSKRPMHIA